MRGPTRLRTLLAVVALALLACAPHRPGDVWTAPAPAADANSIHAALTSIAVEPVVLLRQISATLPAPDWPKGLLPGGVIAMLVIALVVARQRRFYARTASVARGSAREAITPACLRAPPRPT
jgi:hypothetical protein